MRRDEVARIGMADVARMVRVEIMSRFVPWPRPR
jgi:hypothetical protein